MVTKNLSGTEEAKNQRILLIYLFLIAFIYSVQLFSPLRINTDSYRFLSMAVSEFCGNGYLVDGHVDQYPPGYPFTVKMFLQFGLSNSTALILLNLVCLSIALWLLRAWCHDIKDHSFKSLVMIYVLSSYIMIKHVTLPVSDLLYLGVSSLSLHFLLLFYRQEGNEKWRYLLFSAVCGYLALICRTIGVTIFPALVTSILLHRDIAPVVLRLIEKRRAVLAIAGVICVLIITIPLVVVRTEWYASQFLLNGSYFQNLLMSFQEQGLLSNFLQIIRFRMLEMGQLVTNIPYDSSWLRPILYCAGAVAWAVLMRGAWLMFRSRHHLPLWVYFFTYTALMFFWPYYDARFWLPVLPLIAFIVLLTSEEACGRWPAVRVIFRCYLACFFVLGILALMFSTRISLANRDFSEVYGNGTTRMTYRYAFQNGKPVEMDKVNASQVRLLQIFDPLARTGQIDDKEKCSPGPPVGSPN